MSPDEDDYIHTDDYDDSAFDDMNDSAVRSSSQIETKSEDNLTEPTSSLTQDDAKEEKQRQIQASLDEIDAVLESAKKYKK